MYMKSYRAKMLKYVDVPGQTMIYNQILNNINKPNGFCAPEVDLDYDFTTVPKENEEGWTSGKIRNWDTAIPINHNNLKKVFSYSSN